MSHLDIIQRQSMLMSTYYTYMSYLYNTNENDYGTALTEVIVVHWVPEYVTRSTPVAVWVEVILSTAVSN